MAAESKSYSGDSAEIYSEQFGGGSPGEGSLRGDSSFSIRWKNSISLWFFQVMLLPQAYWVVGNCVIDDDMLGVGMCDEERPLTHARRLPAVRRVVDGILTPLCTIF
jgi:hypothetical protein